MTKMVKKAEMIATLKEGGKVIASEFGREKLFTLYNSSDKKVGKVMERNVLSSLRFLESEKRGLTKTYRWAQ